MHIPGNNAKEITTPEGTIWNYLIKKEVGISYQVLTMRSPESGRHLNRECREFYFIIKGTAKFIVGTEEYDVNEKDVVIVEPNTAHYIETKDLTYLTVTSPGWYPGQYERVE